MDCAYSTVENILGVPSWTSESINFVHPRITTLRFGMIRGPSFVLLNNECHYPRLHVQDAPNGTQCIHRIFATRLVVDERQNCRNQLCEGILFPGGHCTRQRIEGLEARLHNLLAVFGQAQLDRLQDLRNGRRRRVTNFVGQF